VPAWRRRGALQTSALVIIALAVVLFLLVQARFILIPLAVSIIVFSLANHAISIIAGLRIGFVRVPNWLASILGVALISAMLVGLVALILAQVNAVLGTVVGYVDRAPAAIADLFDWMGPDVRSAVLEAVQTMEISGYLQSLAGQAGALVQGTVLVILFVGFLFAERFWFSTKLTNFMGSAEQAQQVSRVISSITRKVNYYLLVKSFVSLVTGSVIYVLARLFGLELALTIAVITFVLNFIPNIGSIIATILIALAGYVQLGDPGATFALFVIAGLTQFVIGNILDPILMGHALRLSTFGIIISLAIWAAVWGVAGMFLAVPIMVAMMIVCSHITPLRPLAVLLSREGLPETDVGPAGELTPTAEM